MVPTEEDPAETRIHAAFAALASKTEIIGDLFVINVKVVSFLFKVEHDAEMIPFTEFRLRYLCPTVPSSAWIVASG